MKKLLSIALLSLSGLISVQAATLTIASQGTAADANESNTALGANTPTLAIVGHPGWAAPLAGTTWVSYGETGDPSRPGYFMPPNGLVASFFDSVFLQYMPVSASITVRADDSTAMYINGVNVFDEATAAGNTYTVCSDFVPGCLTTTQITVDITNFLTTGNNTLRFDVAQRASISYGLNYLGTVTTRDADTGVPEPSTFALLGGSLVAIGLWRRRANS